MSKIYAMSDIHGCYEAMMNSIKHIKLEPTDLLVFAGDYVDGGDKSFQVLKTIMNLEKQYPQQVIVLWGNHDEWLSNWLFSEGQEMNLYASSIGFGTVSSFFSKSEIEEISASTSKFIGIQDSLVALDDLFHKKIVQDTKFTELLDWIKEKSEEKRYFETENQIFVHAGVDEEAEEFWKVGTSNLIFTGKYPATTGDFYKDIISGHIYSEEVANNGNYLGLVYWDEKSHYFIDGHTTKSNKVPVLCYDTQTLKYSFLNTDIGNWENYIFR